MIHPWKLVSLLVLLVALLGTGVAATPAVLPQPGQPAVTATANSGELAAIWRASAGAQFYTVGWADQEEVNKMLGAGREWLDGFHFATIPATFTGHTISGLKPETEYYVIVGAQDKRFGATDLTWSAWSDLVPTSGIPPVPDCITTGTCLPISSIGTFSGFGDTADDVFRLEAGIYRFTASRSNTDANFFVDVIELASGDSSSVGIYGRDQVGGQKTLTIYDDDSGFRRQVGNYLLEINTDHDWSVIVEQLAAH